MASRIEDYALIGDCHTAALVGLDASIDWLCLPRFDAEACFAALLGTPEHGRWQLAPAGKIHAARRRYRGETLVLETEFQTDDGIVCVIDCMPPRTEHAELVRLVEGRRGQVRMRMELVIRFVYGSIVPWVHRVSNGIEAIAGPDRLRLETPAPLRGEKFTTVSDFTVSEGETIPFVLSWSPSHEPAPRCSDAAKAVARAERWWTDWARRCADESPWREAVVRSLVTLKALTYAPTGGIVAAPTTSLPEQLGGRRNWDYRYCWLRDSTFTLDALLLSGYHEEARAWRAWLLRAIAGKPSQFQIMYGLAGERLLHEFEIPWLPGYEGSKPVRVGNAAFEQLQLDVYGEVLDAMHQARRAGLAPEETGWRLERAMASYLETGWRKPDEGIWEVRGPRRHFTHSKVMAWVGLDRAIKAVEVFGLEGPIDRWRAVRDAVHAEICQESFDPDLGAFVQSYGAKLLDASLLMMPLVGFLPATDPRIRGTVAAIHKHLTTEDGFVARYASGPNVDGLPPGEGAFLACSFWLADNLALQGRQAEAEQLFERLLEVRNDVGLLSEEFDPNARRLVGNFPQAFSHVALINTAQNLSRATRQVAHRGR